MMMAWIIPIFLGIVLLAVICPVFLRMEESEKRNKKRLLVKGGGTMMMALTALYGAMRAPHPAAWLIVAGLAVCAVADVALELHFVAGMCVFLAGHVLYIVAFAFLWKSSYHLASAIIMLVLYAAIILAFRKELHGLGTARGPYLIYCAVLLLMFSVAVLLPFRDGARGCVVSVGALMFTASDLILARCQLKGSTVRLERTLMYLYYGAQAMFALAAVSPWLLA